MSTLIIMVNIEDKTVPELREFLKRKGESGLSGKRRDELLKLAKRIKAKESRKQKGGNKIPQHDTLASWKDASPAAYNTGDIQGYSAPVHLGAPVDHKGGKKQKGGQQTSGATPLPAQWYTPDAKMPQPNVADDQMSAYGRINAVSGSCRNLAPFPESSGQQTGGAKKKAKKSTKKVDKKSPKKADKKSPKKPAKKAEKKPATKKPAKKEKGLWGVIKGLF